MNLCIAPKGVELTIQKVKLKDDQGKQLANMGFVVGSKVTVISENGGNIIIKVKESRIGLGRDIASKIIVSVD